MSIDPTTYEYPANLLKNRIVLITGASDGIGRALALHAAELGARVVLHGRDTKKLEGVYDEITGLREAARPSIAVMDLATADGDAYSSLVASIEK